MELISPDLLKPRYCKELPILHGVDFSSFFQVVTRTKNYPYYMELITGTPTVHTTRELPILHGVDQKQQAKVKPPTGITHITWS